MTSTTKPDSADRAKRKRPARFVPALLATVGALATLGAATAPRTGAATPSATDQATAASNALDWLEVELMANGGSMPGFSPGSSEWGLTADTALALAAGGRTGSTEAQQAVDLLTGAATGYTTWAPTMPEVRVAGATAKVLLVLNTYERSTIVDGVDLEDELRSLMATSGSQAGRFNDRVPDPTWNASNAFGQSLAMLALAFSDNGVPSQSVQFLLSQQCPSGGFPLIYSDGGCSTDSSADTDATALSLQALLSVDRSSGVLNSLVDGLNWLLTQQDSATGAFGGTGPTSGLNTNSTGLIAQTLRAAGWVEGADSAAEWIIDSNQISEPTATGTPAFSDVGAISYNPAALSSALEVGVTSQVSDQWRRATSQAVLALGLPIYGPGQVEPVTSTPTTSTTSTSTTTTVAPNRPTTTEPVATTTTAAGITATTGAGDPNGATVEGESVLRSPTGSTDATSAVTSDSLRSTQSRSTLPRTGSDSTLMVLIGIAMVFTGLASAATQRRLATRRGTQE
ncbi:MAG: LPXTG cell wall anchor domain-containing protein [Microthrixaceae bacterium]|nr:LPXTG cell wall anchor domain-containing protein [Microthrixaceae bacterium]